MHDFNSIQRGKVSPKLNCKLGQSCKKYRIKAKMKACKKTSALRPILRNNSEKGRQEDYPISYVQYVG